MKFEDDSVIFQTMYACVKEALGRNSFGASIDFDLADTPEMPMFSNDFEKFRPETHQPDVNIDPDYNPFDAPAAGGRTFGGNAGFDGGFNEMPDFPATFPEAPDTETKQQTFGGGTSRFVEPREDYGKLFEERVASQPSVIVVQKKYIASVVKGGMLIVNIRRARERVLYERFLKALSGGEHVCQSALFPVQVEVGADNRLVFDEHADLLKSLGFDITPFGNDTIVVNGMPEGFQVDRNSVEAAMADVLIVLTDNHTALPGMMESSMAEKFAKMGASEGKPVESPVEARSLMDALFACSNSEYTSNGRKIMTVMSPEDIDKMF